MMKTMMLSMMKTNDDDTNDDDEDVMYESDHDDDHRVLLQYIYSVLLIFIFISQILGLIHIYLSNYWVCSYLPHFILFCDSFIFSHKINGYKDNTQCRRRCR